MAIVYGPTKSAPQRDNPKPLFFLAEAGIYENDKIANKNGHSKLPNASMTFPTCVTDHSLNNDVHEEAVVVC
jgi:hypothetical protein